MAHLFWASNFLTLRFHPKFNQIVVEIKKINEDGVNLSVPLIYLYASISGKARTKGIYKDFFKASMMRIAN